MSEPRIDAYCHFGPPRYGTADEALAHLSRNRIGQANLVLGPLMPDLAGLRAARHKAGDAVRLFGIPFGQTPAQRQELAQSQFDLGIAGLRLMPPELIANAAIVEELGRRGLCLMAINPDESTATLRLLLDWLERHPDGTVCAPHFLKPRRLRESPVDPGALTELLTCERFSAIFSRHGGASREPYPHRDLRPWAEDVLEAVGFERVMWGSEFPVLHQRNETVDESLGWLRAVGVALTDAQERRYFHDSAAACHFRQPAPALAREPSLPAWLREQHAAHVYGSGPVPLFSRHEIELSIPTYGRLLSSYLMALTERPALRLGAYLAERLEAAL